MRLKQLTYQNNQFSEDFTSEWDSPHTLAIVYFSPKLVSSSLWTTLKTKLSKSVLIGCTGAGEIKDSELSEDKAVITLAQFEGTEIRFASHSVKDPNDSKNAGSEFAKQFPRLGLGAVYLLSDGLNVNGTALIDGVRSVLGPKVTLAGGLAGDGTDFSKTFVLVNGVPTEKAITGVAFYGQNFKFSTSAEGGWKAFGPLRKVTKSKSNVVYELDNKPALKLYKEFLGEQAKKLPASALLFPLHLGEGTGDNQRDLVRTILSVDENTQSMTFAGDVPEGASVQLMRASHEALVEAAESVGQFNISRLDKNAPTLSLIVSCVGRKLVLGEKTEEEIEAIKSVLPANSAQTGFYSYGEIAPGKSGICDLHNQTMTLTFIQEKKAA